MENLPHFFDLLELVLMLNPRYNICVQWTDLSTLKSPFCLHDFHQASKRTLGRESFDSGHLDTYELKLQKSYLKSGNFILLLQANWVKMYKTSTVSTVK